MRDRTERTPFHCLRDLATACNDEALFDPTAPDHAEARRAFAAALSEANEFVGEKMLRSRGRARRETSRAA